MARAEVGLQVLAEDGVKILRETDSYKVMDAGGARCVVFKDGRTTDKGRGYFSYRNADAGKPEHDEFEGRRLPG